MQRYRLSLTSFLLLTYIGSSTSENTPPWLKTANCNYSESLVLVDMRKLDSEEEQEEGEIGGRSLTSESLQQL